MSKEEQTKMDQITTEMAEFICDDICKHREEGLSQDELDEICCDCKMGQFICEILNTYNELNDFEKSQCCKLLQELSELRKQLPAFKIGDTAYIIDFDEGVIDESVVNGIVSRIDENEIEFEYDSDSLEFHSDDIGVIVFRSREEAQEALKRKESEQNDY